MAQVTDITANHETGAYLEKFTRFETQPEQPGFLYPLRKAGLARFAELGMPTTHNEDWRFTNVAPLVKLPFHPLFESPAVNGAETKVLEDFPFAKLSGHRLVFVNGHFSAKLSSTGHLPAGVQVKNLAAAMTHDTA
ncbi:MAG TPA: Fe-S cluster assembly protein SufD, partial [Verrucomicrobiae bacterium]|nr:Fe-S cluster assembly protein SufD [Verrucomicrobiae bacterium]